MTKPPLAIVWRSVLDVAAYAQAGRSVAAPASACPDCARALARWGGYWRWARAGEAQRIWIHRGRCAPCARTHALLPDFLLLERLDAAEVFGAAGARGVGGVGMRTIASEAGVPLSTVRGWRSRYRARAAELLAIFGALAVELGDALSELPTSVEAAALAALDSAHHAARTRWPGRLGGMWRFASAVCGGGVLDPHTIPRLGGARLIRFDGASP